MTVLQAKARGFREKGPATGPSCAGLRNAGKDNQKADDKKDQPRARNLKKTRERRKPKANPKDDPGYQNQRGRVPIHRISNWLFFPGPQMMSLRTLMGLHSNVKRDTWLVTPGSRVTLQGCRFNALIMFLAPFILRGFCLQKTNETKVPAA